MLARPALRLSALALLLVDAACRATPPPPIAPLSPRPPAAVAPGARWSAPAPAPPAPRPAWAVANEDPDDDAVVGPPAEIADCAARLAALGVRAAPAKQPVRVEGGRTCGAPQVFTYQSGPTGVRWSSPPQVTCLVAIGLARFEVIVEEEAQRHLGAKVRRIDHMGTYACRPMARFNLASEHSFVNAIDIAGVELETGTRVTVLKDWGPIGDAPATPGARFVRAVARRTYDEAVFSAVLGPPWDSLHANHLHLDQSRARVDGLIVR